MLDNKDFTTHNIQITDYRVSYCLFKDTKKYPWNSINNPYHFLNTEYKDFAALNDKLERVFNKACFSGLGLYMQKEGNEDYNRIIYIFNKHSSLSKEECLRWLLLAKQNKFLPRYTSIKKVLQHSNVVFDYSNITFNLLYVYLTIIRMLVEEPKFIKNMLVLVDKYKVNYFAAFIAAKYYGFNNFGHSFCSPSNGYPAISKPNELKKLQLNRILGLYRFIQQNGPDMVKGSKRFSATNKVASMSSSNMLLDINKLVGLDIEDVLNASTDKEAKTLLSKKWAS